MDSRGNPTFPRPPPHRNDRSPRACCAAISCRPAATLGGISIRRPLSASQQAQLERLLLTHWRQRLGLENVEATEAMPRLREHPDAGALLRALEDWLHRRPGTVKVDVEAMLAPYAKASGAAVSDSLPA